MDFLELVKTRQSCRKFDPARPVERDKIEKCLEAARLAPSACNAQPWRYIVVDEPELREKVARATFGPEASFNKFTLNATAMVVLVTEPVNLSSFVGSQLKGTAYRLIDIGASAEHFCLQAAEFGIGTCILGWFYEKKIKKLLNIPKNRSIDIVLAVGYPEEGYPTRSKARKDIDKIRNFNLDNQQHTDEK